MIKLNNWMVQPTQAYEQPSSSISPESVSSMDDDLEFEACNYLSFQTETVETLQDHCLRIEASADCPFDIPAARKHLDAEQWERAIESELESLVENDVYTWVPRPEKAAGILLVPSRVVFTRKPDEMLQLTKPKCRIVAKGYTQIEGVHYEETYAPTAKLTTIRALFAKAVKENLIVHQMDVKTAFLYAPIDKQIYMEPPRGIDHPQGFVWKLNKALYGLKQAPHLWNNTLHEFLVSKGFKRLFADPCMYQLHVSDKKYVEIAVYVDDLILAATHEDILMQTKEYLSAQFQMKDMGLCRYCLGIQITPTTTGVKLHSTQLIKDILKRFNMENCNPSKVPMDLSPLGRPLVPAEQDFPYRELVGSLQYISMTTRPDITHAVSQLSRHLNNFDESHWKAAKKVLRYLKGTKDMGINYSKSGTALPETYCQYRYNGPKSDEVVGREITCFADADFGGSKLDRRSNSGNVNMYAGGPISWFSKVQPTVALSTLEAEYMSMSRAAQEIIWLRLLLKEMNIDNCAQPTTLIGDNQGCLSTVINDKITQNVKHIDIRHHFLRERVRSGELSVAHCSSNEMLADILTKPLNNIKFVSIRDKMGIQ